LPFLKHAIVVGMIFMIANSFNAVFVFVELMTYGGGPRRATEVIPSYLVELAFQYSRFGYGTTVGVVMLIMMLGLSIIIIRPIVTSRQR